MEYRHLGRTAIKVGAVCLGTMTYGEQNSAAEAHAQLDYAVAAGVNFIDTAEMYPAPPQADTHGRTEQYIGSWLKKRGRRKDIVLATKVAGPARLDRADIASLDLALSPVVLSGIEEIHQDNPSPCP